MSAGVRFVRGLLGGLVSGALLTGLILYVGSVTGTLVVSIGEFPSIVDAWYWLYHNLGLSLIPFLLVGLWFGVTLKALGQLLRADQPQRETLLKLESRLDLQTGLFFGVGVIWTAIGMRSALLGALGNLDAESAARLGAFNVLQRLVDEGILLALSTTIVGGIGGYLMRIVKALSVGHELERQHASFEQDDTQRITSLLDAIDTNAQAILHELRSDRNA